MTRSSVPQEAQSDESHHERGAWIAEVEKLASDIEKWAQSRDWAVRRDSKSFTENDIGTYQLPVLTVLTSIGRVVFEPVARYVAGASGRIDLYAFPSFNQVVLARHDGHWKFFSGDHYANLGRQWGEKDFLKRAELQDAA